MIYKRMCRKQKNLLLCICYKGMNTLSWFTALWELYQIECTSQGSKNESDTMLEFVSGAAKGHSQGCNFDLSFADKTEQTKLLLRRASSLHNYMKHDL